MLKPWRSWSGRISIYCNCSWSSSWRADPTCIAAPSRYVFRLNILYTLINAPRKNHVAYISLWDEYLESESHVLPNKTLHCEYNCLMNFWWDFCDLHLEDIRKNGMEAALKYYQDAKIHVSSAAIWFRCGSYVVTLVTSMDKSRRSAVAIELHIAVTRDHLEVSNKNGGCPQSSILDWDFP